MASQRSTGASPEPGGDGTDAAPARAQQTKKRRRAPTAPAAKARRRAVSRPEDLHAAAALIVAHDQARRIAATVRAARAIPGIDLVLVVDDASTDNTQELARKAGAVVVRHSHQRGRTAAIETGASVIAMRDEPGRQPRAVLLLPGALGHHAIGAAPLVPTVTEDVADLAVAVTEDESALSPPAKAARRAIEQASGWKPADPLGTIRCITREALEAAMPLARGSGLEVAMSLDVLRAGLTITEVDCEIRHRPGVRRRAAGRAAQYRDVMMAVSARRVRGGVVGARDAIGRRATRLRKRSGEQADDGAPEQRATTEEDE